MVLRPLKDGDPSGAELLKAGGFALNALRFLMSKCTGVDESHMHSTYERGMLNATIHTFFDSYGLCIDARQQRESLGPSSSSKPRLDYIEKAR